MRGHDELPACFEFNEFNRNSVMFDHINPHAIAGWIRRREKLKIAPFQFLIQIVDFKGDVHHGFDEFVHWAVGFKPHPFDTEGAGFETAFIELKCG